MAKSVARRGKPLSKLGSVIAWAVCTAAAAAVLFAFLGFALNRSPATTRAVVVVLVTLALGLLLLVLHRHAEGRRGLILLMRVVLGLLCLSIVVFARSLSTADPASGSTTTLFNNSDQKVYVKISLIGQSGPMTDKTYALTLAPGERAPFTYPTQGSRDTYAMVMSTYSVEEGGLSKVPLVGTMLADWMGVSMKLGEAFHRDVFAANAAPKDVIVKREGSVLTATDDEEGEDLYLVPAPERGRPGS